MTQNKTEGVVDEFLRERREEVEAENAEEAAYQSRPGGPMTAEQFDVRLNYLIEKTQQRQAARRTAQGQVQAA